MLADIDGVLYRGGKLIAGSDWATQRLLKPFKLDSNPTKDNPKEVCLPFSLLTNGGGDTE